MINMLESTAAGTGVRLRYQARPATPLAASPRLRRHVRTHSAEGRTARQPCDGSSPLLHSALQRAGAQCWFAVRTRVVKGHGVGAALREVLANKETLVGVPPRFFLDRRDGAVVFMKVIFLPRNRVRVWVCCTFWYASPPQEIWFPQKPAELYSVESARLALYRLFICFQ